MTAAGMLRTAYELTVAVLRFMLEFLDVFA
jgi:hypothetical protein